jgi:hypothetical protein
MPKKAPREPEGNDRGAKSAPGLGGKKGAPNKKTRPAPDCSVKSGYGRRVAPTAGLPLQLDRSAFQSVQFRRVH